MRPWIHEAGNGRGQRDVYLNGRPVRSVTYADERRGIVRLTHQPIRIDKYGKRVLTYTIRGRVSVVMLDGQG
jgi:hypothetical protein